MGRCLGRLGVLLAVLSLGACQNAWVPQAVEQGRTLSLGPPGKPTGWMLFSTAYNHPFEVRWHFRRIDGELTGHLATGGPAFRFDSSRALAFGPRQGDPDMGRPSLNVFEFPSGKYEFYAFVYSTGGTTVWSDPLSMRFEVTPGKATYLGRLMVREGKNFENHRNSVEYQVRNAAQGDWAEFHRTYPGISPDDCLVKLLHLNPPI